MLETAGGCWRLLEAAGSSCSMLGAAGSCCRMLRLLKTADGYWWPLETAPASGTWARVEGAFLDGSSAASPPGLTL